MMDGGFGFVLCMAVFAMGYWSGWTAGRDHAERKFFKDKYDAEHNGDGI